MKVQEVMTRSPGTCRIGDSANDAARIMWERDCGSVPVIDRAGHIVGIVTDRDICMAAYIQGRGLAAIPLTSIMSREVCTCSEHEDVTEAERLMRARRVRRLPVTNKEGALAGMVSISDFVQTVANHGGLQQARGDTRELLETFTVVSEPRLPPQPASNR